MQSRTITFNSAKIAVKKFAFLMTLIAGMTIFNCQNVQGQILMEIEDIIAFGGDTYQSNESPFSQNKSVNIQISPNPVSDHAVILKEPHVDVLKLEIVDMQGNLRYVGYVNGGNLFIPNLESGLYNFRVYTSEGATSKIMSVN